VVVVDNCTYFRRSRSNIHSGLLIQPGTDIGDLEQLSLGEALEAWLVAALLQTLMSYSRA
jgi:hypothetical protein